MPFKITLNLLVFIILFSFKAKSQLDTVWTEKGETLTGLIVEEPYENGIGKIDFILR